MKKLVVFLALACLSLPVLAQTYAISPVGRQQFFGAGGVPLAGGKIYTYLTGTSTPQATYADMLGAGTNTNPIILDAGGFTPSPFLLPPFLGDDETARGPRRRAPSPRGRFLPHGHRHHHNHRGARQVHLPAAPACGIV